jgi:hypothetical protein
MRGLTCDVMTFVLGSLSGPLTWFAPFAAANRPEQQRALWLVRLDKFAWNWRPYV